MSNKDPNRNPNQLAALRQRLAASESPEFWRSLEELSGSESFMEFLHNEFPRETSWVKTLSRRDFLKLLAAPLALAGLSACTPQPVERIVPYAEAPEGLVPGKPLFFATAMELDGYARGLVVESHMGRPTKVEGNPQHPASLGATDVFSQASVLTLYDPDRAQVVSSRGQIRTWEAFQRELRGALEAQGGLQGAGLRLLTGAISSPTLAAQIRGLLEQHPQARWHVYEPVGTDNVRQGAQEALGDIFETTYNLDNADVILSLDSNFMFREPGSVRYMRQFASRRPPHATAETMNRLYVVESSLTITGSSADHRLAVQASQVEGIARAIAARLGAGSDPGNTAAPAGWIDAVAADLDAHRGRCVVMAGPQQPPAVHVLAHTMNAALGNAGQTVLYTRPVLVRPEEGQGGTLADLVQDLNAGAVDILLILSDNPVFNAPADVNFAAAMEQARLSVYLGMYEDETARRANWHIPATHYLEMWSDTRAFDGTVSIVQPLIEPLYNGHSPHELLAIFSGQTATDGYEIVRAVWQERFQTGNLSGESAQMEIPPTPPPGEEGTGEEDPAAQPDPGEEEGEPANGSTGAAVSGFERFWQRALHDGMIEGSALTPVNAAPLSGLEAAPTGAPAQGEMELVFEPDPGLWDGRFANNAWLQELPRPLTKLTWDNAALISPATAERLGVQNEQVVELHFRGRAVEAPVYILGGQPENSVTIHLGFGRRRGGNVLTNTGFNAYQIRPSEAMWFGSGLEVRPTGKRYRLATTQDHFSLEGRPLVRSATAAVYAENPAFAMEFEHGIHPSNGEEEQGLVPKPPSMYPEHPYDDNAWGMTINLNACNGCNACVVACQSENNVPVVGKDEVLTGREMHWLRVDRYFAGNDLDNPEVYFQPVLCMHCEQAPCEPVCPVNATVHDDEGLNNMVYNRCVGTRYCSNNCPYKVRRFNFYQYSELNSEPLKMLNNPDVTVRNRGVMEKCTYCVQRISAGRIRAKIENRAIADGEVVPACAQACPTQAIVFGNLNDPNSQVVQMKQQPLNYAMLAELGTRPRTSYLAQVRNTNPQMPEGL
jgi:MoCo/4Fe-4S cofactor protein with predicted Tat translocation signal